MIGYYVHHHGSGHLMRARAIAAACAEPVVALSSLPEPVAPHPFAGWVRLPDDPPLASAEDPDAHGVLHWAPLNSPDYSARMHALVRWCGTERPRAVVVDLSVEVTMLLRLVGVPVIVVTLPGERDDAAHTLAFGVASLILAPWPRRLYDPPHLRAHGDRTVYVGAVSRWDAPGALGVARPATGRVLALLGSGGLDDETTADDIERELGRAGVDATVLGGGRWGADVQQALLTAEVVLTHAGTNALAEVAATRRPAVVVPQRRPFGEQHATASALATAGLAVVLPAWPRADRLRRALDDARKLGGHDWSRWHDGAGPARAAAAIAAVAS